MRKNRTIYALCAAACFIFSIVYQSRISAVLLFAVLGYIPAALLVTFVSLLLIKTGFAEERGVYEKSTPTEFGIYISNRFIVGLAPAELICWVPDRDIGIFVRKRIYASLPPLGKCRISVAGMHRYRGSYTARLERVAVYDPLRIIRLSRKLDEQMTQVFLPRKIPLGDLISAAAGERSVAQLRLPTGEKEEFSHVREYLDGDLIQLVHWKLTAKADELMMKQFEENAQRRALILCDYGIDASDAGLMLRADCIIETAIAFAMSAADAGVQVKVDFGAADGGFVSLISDKAGFERFYELMSVLPAKLEVCPFSELVRDGMRSDASMVFLITARLNEETAQAAQLLAGSFSGLVVLAYINLSDAPLPEYAQNGGFLLLNIRGEGEEHLLSAIEESAQQNEQ